MNRGLKPAGVLAAAVVAWLAFGLDWPAGGRVAGVGVALALDMDLRQPMFSQPSRSRRVQRPAPDSTAARGQPYRRPQAYQPPPSRGLFDSLFGAPQRPQYQPGYRARPPATAKPARPAPRRNVRRPAQPPTDHRRAIEQTEFVYLLAPPSDASLGAGLEAVLADRPVVGVRALRASGDETPAAARLMAALPATLAPPGKSAVLVIVAAPEWLKSGEAQLSALVAEMSAAMATRQAPVIWVGLPPVAEREQSARYAAANGVLRAAAEKAGGGFVDAWAVFADDGGGFAAWGPAVNGEITRLREDQGGALTRAGARKLAHFIMVEVRRIQARRLEEGRALAVAPADPFSLPGPQLPPSPAASTAAPPPKKPDVGPVLPLNVVRSEPGGQLVPLDGGRRELTDVAARSALRDGAPPPALPGRADDFRWPRPGG